MAEEHVVTDQVPPTTTDNAGATISGSSLTGRGSGRTLPLNSRRLTAPLLRQIAAGLGVPSTASQGDLLPMIEGKLTEEDRDPLRTQVVLREVEGGTLVCLQDESGVFREIEPPELDNPEDPQTSSEREEEDETESEVVATLRAEIAQLRTELERQKAKTRDLWRVNCEQLAEMDGSLVEKDEEISRLKDEVARLRRSSPSDTSETTSVEGGTTPASSRVRRGKAPPVDPFTGEDPVCRLDDWLPTLKRAAEWNGWTEGDLLLQLAGHLKGRALQEWNLMADTEKTTYSQATAALAGRLDPGSRIMAAQDFRHASQEDCEKVGDFIRRLEQLFKLAYGHDAISAETRAVMLYGQMHEGLKHRIMESSAVSGATDYKGLCLAAKAEEKRLAAIKKRRLYHSEHRSKPSGPFKPADPDSQPPGHPQGEGGSGRKNSVVRCWNCRRTGHVAAECKAPRRGGSDQPSRRERPPRAQQVQSDPQHDQELQPSDGTTPTTPGDPKQYLLSDSEEQESKVGVNEVRVQDKGSRPQYVRVVVAGVPVDGIVDTAADITIVGAEAFKRIAAVAKLRKRDLKSADKTPRTYDQKLFRLDGCLDLDISFQERTLKTPVYVKMDAREQLLLSEGVCRQLGIVQYHEQVSPGDDQKPEVSVPMVRVHLVQTVKLRPNESLMAEVELVKGGQESPVGSSAMLLESDEQLDMRIGARIATSLVKPSSDGVVQVLVSNSHSLTHRIPAGTEIGHAVPVEVVEPEELAEDQPAEELPCINYVSDEVTGSKSMKLREARLIDLLDNQLRDIPEHERTQLVALLEKYSNAFSVTDGERGETGWTEIHIDTGNAVPKKQPVRRVPFAVRQELARQLKKMQDEGVIQPSSSPWSSAIVLVRKKDGTLRICVDYRHLNSVTKLDTFPLPRIDDLLDQLGSAKYFTTLDLAAGYWQIRVADDSIEKTAFITPGGLYEFRVMPFGLTNAPAIFQRLMQQVLQGLNPAEGPSFVSVYIDDVLIFSRSLEEHLHHIGLVLDRLQEAGLKLKPSKCHFVCQQVEYLGHLITPRGLLPNPKKVGAVVDFPVPTSVTQVRQFVGLASYYRRFIEGFARVAAPLHRLTKQDVEFQWTGECQDALDMLKKKLVEAPVLVYPDFNVGFVLETDASYQGLGAVLSQKLEDQLFHPVSFSSRALSPSEKNYAVTELETLAVVWAIKHYRAYLYGHDVQVVTDHSAVKSLLSNPSASGKHARWWLQVYGSGVRKVDIVYRPGRENARADALSRNPTEPPDHHPLDAHVAALSSDDDISTLLQSSPGDESPCDLPKEQQKDPDLRQLRQFLEFGILPEDEGIAKSVAAQALHFTVVDDVLYYVDGRKGGRRRAAVPRHLQQSLLKDYHAGKMAGHFSGARLYSTLCRSWWWRTMYKDVMEFCRSCGECATVTGVGRRCRPPLHPIPVQRPFQIIGVDIMELPVTEQGNRYVIVFQDFLTKWPLVFPAPDQKAIRLARLVAEEILPLFGVPDALLSDRGTNLLAHVMQDVCELLGIQKLNTTAYHPQCDGMVERLNRTLKSMLRKHVAKFHGQWDRFLPGALWAYRNTPHESTKEKPSFLLFGIDLKSPTEASLLPPDSLDPTDLGCYREELILSLSTARELAAASIQEAQKSYKYQYDKRTNLIDFRLGDWVFVRFPEEETGKKRKLSRPWYGPFRVTARHDPNLTVKKVYFPEDPPLTVHQMRVCTSPGSLPAGFYWYGARRKSSGRTPTWLQRMLNAAFCENTTTGNSDVSPGDSHPEDGAISTDELHPETPEPSSEDCPAEDLIDASLGPENGPMEETPANVSEESSSEKVIQGRNLRDLSMLPYAVHNSTVATSPKTSPYTLRDRSSRQKPQRLMQVDSSGRTSTEEGEM